MHKYLIHPFLDKDKQKQAQRYEKEKRKFALTGKFLSTVLLIMFYYSGYSLKLAEIHSSPWAAFLIYMFIFTTVFSIIFLPFKFFTDYRIEHKWGFSNHSLKSWYWDELKGFIVGLVFMFLITGFLFWIWQIDKIYWWFWTGLAMVIFSVILSALFPVIILPIFNKYDVIDNPALVKRLTKILEKYGLKASGFFRQNMSRQTKKENAFLGGLGKTRRVVLADNLIDHMSESEIESVIAHEIGHYHHQHIWKNMFIGTVQQFLLFYLVNIIILNLFPEFLESMTWNLTIFPMFILILSWLSGLLFSIPNLALSRYFERQADLIALETSDPIYFKKAMAGLANRNLSNAYPETWVKVLFYSHPPVGERLALAEAYENNHNLNSQN